jgi:hypothetical protein
MFCFVQKVIVIQLKFTKSYFIDQFFLLLQLLDFLKKYDFITSLKKLIIRCLNLIERKK